ncbi:phosphoenolpyruvate--protein phosphotransferase, partial [Sphingomonas sp.]|uniref:phosphoenolpyruvate--protein phosphotransferase n=1 Tax=Sphingomonas sp. TaxID=28214 RepID=UPI0025DAAC65
MSEVRLASPMSGWLMNIRDVDDPVFSDEMMGPGIAIDPTEGVLVAPCDAVVTLVAPTRHSVTLRTESGAEFLIHVGLETVALNGRGFEAHVSDGDRVAAGDRLISFDMDAVGLNAKSLATPIVLTNGGEFEWSPAPLDRLVERGEPIGAVRDRGSSSEAGAVQGDAVTLLVPVRFEHGLHARPAARVADCAKRYSSAVTIRLRGKSAAARSPVAVMALDARHGDKVELIAVGPDAQAAVEAIAALLEEGELSGPVTAGAEPTARSLAANEIAGACALPGAVLGTVRHWRRHVIEAAEEGRGVAAESAALEGARAKVRAHLQALGDRAGGPAAAVAQAHMGLLDDEKVNADAAAELARGRSASMAWQVASAAAADSFRASDNARLRERIADIEDVSAQVVAALAGTSAAAGMELPEATVLLADELLPSELMSLPRDRVVGLATSGGGPTSHMAIIAASFGIPTLVAMGPRLAEVPDGTAVLLDATAGVLVLEPDELARGRAGRGVAQAGSGDCITRDGERVRLLANLGGLAEVQAALAAGAEGCGLLRTEFLFLDRADAPSEAEQRGVYQAIADALDGRPLTIRTLDIGGDKPVPYIRFPNEQNPALGARGVRTGLFDPELLDEQVRAIARVQGDQIKVMLPMVSSADELKGARRRLSELGAQAKVGVMIETPAAALIAERLAQEADFLSIGSNDLAQYTLAMDRTNPLLAASIDALHPAVLRLIATTAEAGRAAGTPVSLCGSLASEPAGAIVLIGLGIGELSAVPAAIPAVRQAIGRVSAADCRALAIRALSLESAAQVRALAA